MTKFSSLSVLYSELNKPNSLFCQQNIADGRQLGQVRLFQYFGHLMRRVDSLEKTLMLGGIGGRRNGMTVTLADTLIASLKRP